MESMARRRLCLVSDSVGFISYLDVSTALIFKSGNQQSLTKSIEDFLNLDNESHLNMLTNAYKLSKQFEFKEIAAKHNDFLFYDDVH